MTHHDSVTTTQIRIVIHDITLEGDLSLPAGTHGLVLFAHGSGSGRHSPRNQYVAQVLQQAGLATLLFDLLTPHEEQTDNVTRHLRFDIPLLAQRLIGATDWVLSHPDCGQCRIGYFGASTGSAAALIAAAERADVVEAVVSRGGRPDLAEQALSRVRAPTLLMVGGLDDVVIGLNERALEQLRGIKEMVVVPGATHLFEEPGKLEEVARLARRWFERYLLSPSEGAGSRV